MNNGDKHPISDRLIDLINTAIEDVRGSKAAFCRQCGISPYNLSKILRGDRKFVFGDMWNKLCDYFPEIDDRPKIPHNPDPMLDIILQRWARLTPDVKGVVVDIVIKATDTSAKSSSGAAVEEGKP